MSPVKTKWLLSTKRDMYGQAIKRKARLVAQGFAFESASATYSPLAGWDSYLACLAVSSELGLKSRTADVSTAYLFSEVKEEIYLVPPEGHPAREQGKYFKLLRSLYGISSSGRNFYDYMAKELKTRGWKACDSDQGVFYRRRGGQTQILVSYVDDLCYFAREESELKEIEEELRSFVKIKNTEGMDYLGVRIDSSYDGDQVSYRLHQEGHIEQITAEQQLQKATPIYTASEVLLDREDDNSAILDQDGQTTFRSLIGSLSFITNRTRPDGSFVVSSLAGRTGVATNQDLQAARRLVRYLYSTRNYRLVMKGSGQRRPTMNLQVYTDAAFAPSKKDCKSRTGIVVCLNGSPVFWASRKQKVCVSSTSASEYIAAHDSSLEGRHMGYLIREVSGIDPFPFSLEVDNQSAISWIDSSTNKGSRYVDIRYHAVRDMALDGALRARYCSTQTQVADLMTKTLPGNKICKLLSLIGMEGGKD